MGLQVKTKPVKRNRHFKNITNCLPVTFYDFLLRKKKDHITYWIKICITKGALFKSVLLFFIITAKTYWVYFPKMATPYTLSHILFLQYGIKVLGGHYYLLLNVNKPETTAKVILQDLQGEVIKGNTTASAWLTLGTHGLGDRNYHIKKSGSLKATMLKISHEKSTQS